MIDKEEKGKLERQGARGEWKERRAKRRTRRGTEAGVEKGKDRGHEAQRSVGVPRAPNVR